MLVHFIYEPIICAKILCRHWQAPSALFTSLSLSAETPLHKHDLTLTRRDRPHRFQSPFQPHLGQALPMVLAVVTGASRGLGFENAKSLAALGYDIVMIAKDPSRLSQAQESLQHNHPNQHFTTYAVDLEELQATRNIVEMISQHHGSPELLILAHGVMSDKMSKTLKTNDAEWRRVMAINLDSVFISVKDPDGNNVWNESLNSDNENKFSTLIIAGIGGWTKSGNYLVVAESGNYVASTKFFYDSGAQVNPPSAVSDYYVSQEDLYLTFTIAVIIVAGIFIFSVGIPHGAIDHIIFFEETNILYLYLSIYIKCILFHYIGYI